MSVKLKILQKTATVLDCFTATAPVWSATALAKAIQMPVTTIHSILSDLVSLDFLTQDPHTKEYRIGARYLEMGVLHSNNYKLNNIAHGVMNELALSVKHVVGLSLLYKGWSYVSMAVLPFEGTADVRYTGSRYPAHMAAGGIAILAQLPQKCIELYCKTDWTEHLVAGVTLPELEEHLQQTRAKGYSIPYLGEGNSGAPIRSIGAPIFGRDRKVLAALVIIGPREGFSEEMIAPYGRSVIQAANEITMHSAHLSDERRFV